MEKTKSQLIRQASNALHEEQFPEAERILEPLQKQYPWDWELFYLLNACYMRQEKWDFSEQLILHYGQTCGEVPNEHLLQLYLAKNDKTGALKTASVLIAENPDFYDSIASWGFQFKEAGLEQAYLELLTSMTHPGYDPFISVANFHAQIKSDYKTAVEHILEGLKIRPDDELLQSYLASYRQSLVAMQQQEARLQLNGTNQGDGIDLYRELLELRPSSITAQEYYLCALACKKFPPFYVYFHQNNFVSTAPYLFRAILFAVFCIACALYYKGGIAENAYDQMKSVVWLFAALTIPRYTLFPLSVQVLAFRYVPGYHLLKKPFDFLKGLLLLLCWLTLLYHSLYTAPKGFDYFLVGCFALTFVGMLDIADDNPSPLFKNLLRIYSVITMALGILSYLKIIPDVFLFFVFGGWLPPLLVGMVFDFYRKMQQPAAFSGGDADENKDIQLNRRVHVGALVVAVLFFILYFIGIKTSQWMSFFAFGGMMYFITLFAVTEDSAESNSLLHILKNKPLFRLLFGLCTVGMLFGLLFVVPYAKVPIRSTWHWIPGVLVFVGSWIGLFVLNFRYIRNRTIS